MVRNLLRTGIDSFPNAGIPFYSVGILSVFMSARSKRIGDYVAGTVVIREGDSHRLTLDDVRELTRFERDTPATGGEPLFTIDPKRLGPPELDALRVFMIRRFELAPEVRNRMAFRIAVALAAVLSIPNVPMMPEDLLVEIDRQYRRYRIYED
jgi:hypothetical protein